VGEAFFMSLSFHRHLTLFGGSFNPPHVGHAQAANGLLKNPGVGKLLVLPTYGNPMKPGVPAFEHRLQMAKLNFPEFEVTDFEGVHQTKSTFDLLSRANLIAGEQPVAFVIGTDQFENLASWVNFPTFLGLCDWIVMVRKPKKLDACETAIRAFEASGVLKSTRDPMEFEVRANGKVRSLRFVETDATEVSSTQIREKLALGKKTEITAYLKKDVLAYVERNSLYGT
jgi:nicotinate-nucleotide adenylyltransferase